MIGTIFAVLCLALLGVLAFGSLLNLSDHPHWLVRGWDFPRLQIIGLALLLALIFVVVDGGDLHILPDEMAWVVAGLTLFVVVWHGRQILPYTLVGSKQSLPTKEYRNDRFIRLVFSNVEQDNQQYDRWMRTIESADADLVVGLEFNEEWVKATKSLRDQFPYVVEQAQDNFYGMVMWSRYPIVQSRTRFVVQPDVPSIDARIALPSDDEVRIISIHPRPPEPVRDQNSVPRDAELTWYGKELRGETDPVIVGGDLNDVAWSRTTRLFLRISNLLDPRRGRGFYNTFHARHRFLRIPLDHVFHSRHFTLHGLRRLEAIGSDHFPILVELQMEHRPEQIDSALQDSLADHLEAQRLMRRDPDASDKAKPLGAAE